MCLCCACHPCRFLSSGQSGALLPVFQPGGMTRGCLSITSLMDKRQDQLGRLPVLPSHASAFFMLNRNRKYHLCLTLGPSPSGRRPLQTDHQPRALLSTEKEGEGGTYQAASVPSVSEHSQQCMVISCVSPPTPLNLENQADFSRQQSAPRHIEP